MDNHDQLDELSIALLGAYTRIGKLLGWLPLPIGIPSIKDENWSGPLAAVAIDRARIAMRDLPLERVLAGVMDKLLLEWLTVRDLGVMADALGPDEWRLETMAYGLLRLKNLADIAETRLRPSED
ncbi:hypothetical protein FHS43_000555 [Streptosporangium becharense]|uniref:Uncharacterized protein n=1 Tax=Streptosporangium becharense TaxID=1816182 RepID=A0A7W9IN52_9ACTN|nr:hypothetical protein [Streptosporangium becharense]MBB2909309.1 hypothetical protein [Streptosporangium becharense]MBB5823788.1 hypothetical protein [Streptosporangium becharense]